MKNTSTDIENYVFEGIRRIHFQTGQAIFAGMDIRQPVIVYREKRFLKHNHDRNSIKT